MDGFKEFQGKNLDDAINEACAYFDATRERLEIDIVQDSKSGIFGLVGARKAKIKARRVQLRVAMDDILGRSRENETVPKEEKASLRSEPAAENNHKAAAPAQAKRAAPKVREKTPEPKSTSDSGIGALREAKPASGSASKPEASVQKYSAAEGERERNGTDRGERSSADRRGHNGQSTGGHRPRAVKPRQREQRVEDPNGLAVSLPTDDGLHEDVGDGLQLISFEDMDTELLSAVSSEVVGRLVEPIVGQVPLRVELQDGRVNVCIDCGEDSGLLIGREGQTLASLQYLASRMVSRAMKAIVRVQLDAGDYRLRQDEKLREMALALAERVRATGKSYSTRPLSSYHRRIVHVALQDATDVQTRSSGDGPLKRVVLQRKRH